MSASGSHASLFTPAVTPTSTTETTGLSAEMCDSGFAWLKSVPAHWRAKRLKYAVNLINQKTEDTGDLPYVGLEHIESWTGRRIESEAPVEPEGIASRFNPGDVLFGKLRPYLAKALHAREAGVCTSEALVMRPRLVAPEYLFYYLMNPAFVSVVDGSTYGSKMPRANWEFIGNLPCLLPPLPEQEAIAAWLDERTRRVDELVAAKRRLIDLLAEQRTALITHAVTKGLNPAAPMKPSGIDWLGDVPGHWEVRRLRHLVSRIEQGWSPEADQREAGEDEWAVMRAGCANGGRFNEADHKALPLGITPDPSLEIRPGDLLMSRACGSTDLVGSVALVGLCRPKLLLCDKLFRLRYPKSLTTADFLAVALGSRLVRLQLERDLSGAEGLARNIAQSAIKELVVTVPPLDEQRAIVARLDAACARFDALTAAAEAAIARLTEYRQALISAAVTGKINVCGAASTVQPEAASSCEPVIAGRINGEIGGTGRTANKHFQRSVLAAEIIARIGQDRTFGRVKLQKALILAECHLQLDEIESQPIRAAAGPFDNAMMRSIQSQLQKSQWYEYRKDGDPLKFVPLAKAGGHKQYFERYWGAKEAAFAALMDLLAKLDTQRSEIVATLYSAWNDFLIDQKPVTDDALVAEVLTSWDPAKTAIPQDKWRKAIGWMRGKGLVPTGYGAHTKARVIEEAD